MARVLYHPQIVAIVLMTQTVRTRPQMVAMPFWRKRRVMRK